ncbi:MAG: anti-sigma factor [Acidobacteria bacterium]|nr:anti-sigma factor [Acidobacteriota bacterium]
MTDNNKNTLLDLLTKRAISGLDADEQRQLDEFDDKTAQAELDSLEVVAAAIGMAGLSEIEPMPAHLRTRIAEDAKAHVAANVGRSWPKPNKRVPSSYAEPARTSSNWFGWLGWAAAAAACIALGFNVYVTRFSPANSIAKVEPTPAASPKASTPAEQRDELMRTAPDLIKASWAAGNQKDIKQLSGDVVWSDSKQAGYMRFTGLPVNDATTTCYQLWIFDKTQDKATPIDGGVFDVSKDGEIIVPITAKLNAVKPEMFALTIEKHGGVVVSKREKIAALAKVETQPSQGA